jgi:hypothetical protein
MTHERGCMSEPSDGKKHKLAHLAESTRATLQRSSWLARWIGEAPSRWLGRRSTVGQDLLGGADGLAYLRGLARGNRVRRQETFEKLDPGAPPICSSTASSAPAARCTCSRSGCATTASWSSRSTSAPSTPATSGARRS